MRYDYELRSMREFVQYIGKLMGISFVKSRVNLIQENERGGVVRYNRAKEGDGSKSSLAAGKHIDICDFFSRRACQNFNSEYNFLFIFFERIFLNPPLLVRLWRKGAG